MRNHNDETSLGYILQNIHNLHAEFTIQCTRRLVRKNNLGIVDYGSCNRDALHLSTAQLVWAFVNFLVHIDFVERGNRLGSTRLFILAYEAQCKLDVFEHGEMGNKIVTLENETDGRISVRVPMLVVKIARGNSADDEVTAGVSVKTAYDVEHSGFSATGRTENCNKLALSEIERYFAKRMHRSGGGGIIFYDVFKLEHNPPQC